MCQSIQWFHTTQSREIQMESLQLPRPRLLYLWPNGQRPPSIAPSWGKLCLGLNKRAILIGYSAYVMILVVSLRATVALTLTPYVTSAFGAHSLIPLTNLLAYVVAAVIQLPLSRVISHSGHLYTLIAMVLLDTLGRLPSQDMQITTMLTNIGLILLATCRTVEWYAAAFVWVLFCCHHEMVRLTVC